MIWRDFFVPVYVRELWIIYFMVGEEMGIIINVLPSFLFALFFSRFYGAFIAHVEWGWWDVCLLDGM